MSNSIKVSDLMLGTTILSALGSAYFIYKTIEANKRLEEEEDEKCSTKVNYNMLPSPIKLKKKSEMSVFGKRLRNDLDTSLLSFNVNDFDLNSDDGKEIHKICITGGRKSGKRTATTFLKEMLIEFGYKVFIIPDLPSLTKKGGFNLFGNKLSKKDKMQEVIAYIKMLTRLEDYFLEMAHSEEKDSVLIIPYGTLEAKANVGPEIWEGVLAETGWTEINLSHKRYDVVLHMVTAADGAKEYVEEKNIEKCIKHDKLIRKAWTGHHNFNIIQNRKGKSFHDKLNACFDYISAKIGLPTKNKFFKKYLLENCEIQFPEDIDFVIQNQEESFLKSMNDKMQIRLVKRGSGGLNRYVYAARVPSKNIGDRIELMRQITAREYMEFKKLKRDNRISVQKKVYCFLFNNCSFRIDKYLNTKRKLIILRIESSGDLNENDLPPFLKIKKEISENTEYSTFKLAKIK